MVTPALLWCGVVVGPLFIIVFLIEGMLRKGYQPLRQPVSALAMGPRGWVQRANFFVAGSLAFAYALGLFFVSQGTASLIVGLMAIGVIGAGVFVTDITGLEVKPRTKTGIVHD